MNPVAPSFSDSAPGIPAESPVATRLANYQPSGRSRIGSLLGVKVAATGSYVPENVVRNEDLAALGCDSDWIQQRTGILQRRHADPSQATSDLAYEAAIRCLAQAKLEPSEVDLILVATITPDHATPSTACHLQRRLGCVAPAMDINAACAGFMYALVTGCQFVHSGAAKNVLVIGAEVMTRTIDPDDKKTYPLFGDGAGAVLLTPGDHADQGLTSFTLGSEGIGGELLCIHGGGSREPLSAQSLAQGRQFLRMEGRSVFKWAVRVVVDSSIDVLGHAGLRPSDLQLVILHQANMRIIDSAVSDFGIDRSRIFVNVDKYGNTSAASIPLALDEAVQAGKISRGNRILLCGFGAGLAWGTTILHW